MNPITTLTAAAVGGLVACSDPWAPTTPLLPTPELNVERELISTIPFTSTRHDPTANPLLAAEIYLMNGNGTNPRRVTENSDGEGLPVLSPDGKKIVFDSNRLRGGASLFTSDLFVMNTDGTEQRWLARGSSATWSPDSKNVAFHASASGTGLPIRMNPGSATEDSDIFVMNVDDVLAGDAQPTNITNNPETVDDDPDWSPNGQQIVFTRHGVNDPHINSVTAEIYVINAGGTGSPTRLTNNLEEERAPAWSPDGTRILFMCRRDGTDFELCVMNADRTDLPGCIKSAPEDVCAVQLTKNDVPDLTATWSPDGEKVVFHRPVAGRNQLFVVNADGTGQAQLTNTVGHNLFANWGELRQRVGRVPPVQP